MKGVLLLTFRHMAFNRIKSLIMIVCLTITFFLPIAVQLMIRHYEEDLTARAQGTPLIVGAKGNRYDLTLKTLYFSSENPDTITQKELAEFADGSRALPIPMHLGFTARQKPIVGTDLDYFEFRHLKLVGGRLPVWLGEAVIGSQAAAELNLKAGDTLLTDQTSLYNLAAVYPLKMHIVGVFAATGSPDDHAIFVDVKTAWVIEGVGHGHTDMTKTKDSSIVLERKGNEVVGNAAMVTYTEVTQENMDGFHFHGDQAKFRLTSLIVLPDSAKSATVLKGRYAMSPTSQMLVPVRVIEELMRIVFQVKKFFDGIFGLICLAMLLFVGLVVMLSLQIRKREMETMFRLGCSRAMTAKLQVVELGLVILVSLVLALILSGLLLWVAPQTINVI